MAEVMRISQEEIEKEEFKAMDNSMEDILNASKREQEAKEQADINAAMRASRLGFTFNDDTANESEEEQVRKAMQASMKAQ